MPGVFSFMEAEQECQNPTIEKQETRLLDEYQDTLQLLYKGNISQGTSKLERLLANPILSSRQFDGLRYSVLQSLAELSEKHSHTLDAAIYYLHEAIGIREHFLLWRRLAGLCRRRGYLEQAQYATKKAMGSAPVLSREPILYELAEIALLREDYRLGLEICEQLLKSHFRTASTRALKLYCLNRVAKCQGIHIEGLNIQSELAQLSGVVENSSLQAELLELKQQPIVPTPAKQIKQVSPCLMLSVSANTTWASFLAELYIILKYSEQRNPEKQRKRKSARVYKAMQEFFTDKNYLKMAVRVTSQKSEQGDKLQTFSQAYLTAKRKRNRQSGHVPKISCDSQRQYLSITGNINIKDYVTNPAVHIDSLVQVLAKHRRKDLSRLKAIKAVNEEMWPQQDFCGELRDFTEELTMVRVLDTGRAARVEEEEEEVEAGEKADTGEMQVEAQGENVTGEKPLEEQKKKNADSQVVAEQIVVEVISDAPALVPAEAPTVQPVSATSLQQASFKEMAKRDFQEFKSTILDKCFSNIIQLVHRVVIHFVANKQRGLCSSTRQPLRSSLRVSPHYLLRSSQQHDLKYAVTRLYLRSLRLSSGDMYNDCSSKLTLLQLTVDRCTQLSNRLKTRSQPPNPKPSCLHHTILTLQSSLFLTPDFSQFMSRFDLATRTCLRLRAYHSLGIFFSLPEHESQAMVEKILPKYQKYQQEYERLTGQRSVNVFWLDMGVTKGDLAAYLETRLHENRVQREVETMDVSEEMGTVLRSSIDNFRKAKDKSLAEAVELYYRNIVEMVTDDKLPFGMYLDYLAQLLVLYLQLLQRKPAKQDHGRYICKVDELMKQDDLALHLLRRTNQQKQTQPNCIRRFLHLSALFSRILLGRFLVLDCDGSSHLMKGLLCCLTYLIRSMSSQQRSRLVPDLLLFVHTLGHLPTDNLSLHRKINTHFMSKFVDYLYDDPRIQEETEEVIDVEETESRPSEQATFRSEAEDALKCFYGFSQKKLGDFAPATLKELESFCRYLKLFYPQYFDRPSCRIKLPIANILKSSQKLILEAKQMFCGGLDLARKRLCTLYDGSKRDDEFMTKLLACMFGEAQPLCDCGQPNCFERVKTTRTGLIDAYYAVARSLENDELTDEVSKEDVERAFRHAERLYQTVLCLDPSKGRSWYTLFKINKKKAFVYFDSLIYEEPLENWKNAFLAAKKVAAFIKQRPAVLCDQLRNELQQDLFILNLLKIYERKFVYMQSKQQSPPKPQDVKSKQLKLFDAFTTIVSKLDSPPRTLRIEYLSLVHLLQPYYLKCSFSSSNCARLLTGLVGLRQALKEDEDNPCRLSDEQLYPEILLNVYKVLARYMELIKIADPVSRRAVFGDLSLWLNVVRTQGLGLLDTVLKTETDYFENYYNRARDQFEPERGSQYVALLQSLVEQGVEVEVPADIRDQVNTVVHNLKLQLRAAMAKGVGKKARLMRYFASCCYYLSKVQLRFENDRDKAVRTMSELVNIKFDDIIQIYRYYENQSLERDPKLSEFFNRNLPFLLCKYKYIRYVIQLYFEVSDYDRIRQLHRKLSKLAPKDGPRANLVFALLQRTSLEYSLNSLWEMLVSEKHLDEFERWLLELYDRIARPRKSPKTPFADSVRQLFAGYYVARQREANPHCEIPENGRFEKGLAMLEDKHRKKKPKDQPK